MKKAPNGVDALLLTPTDGGIVDRGMEQGGSEGQRELGDESSGTKRRLNSIIWIRLATSWRLFCDRPAGTPTHWVRYEESAT